MRTVLTNTTCLLIRRCALFVMRLASATVPGRRNGDASDSNRRKAGDKLATVDLAHATTRGSGGASSVIGSKYGSSGLASGR